MVGPGHRAIVYIELNLPRAMTLHKILVEFECLDTIGKSFTVRSGVWAVDEGNIPVLAPPLAAGTWVAVHDPSWERGHRRVIYTLAGRAKVPGRYAVDWVGVDNAGHIGRGDPDRPADAIGYGAHVRAGADAIVVAVRDGMKESRSIAGNSAKPLGDGSGNYVVLQLRADRFAFYEHLKPGSIRVRPGDRVHLGQNLGDLGFSGDTTGPHLHMHVADCSSPLACEGIPFAIEGMTHIGRYTSLSDLGVKRWQNARPRGRLRPEWPGYNVVVRFAD